MSPDPNPLPAVAAPPADPTRPYFRFRRVTAGSDSEALRQIYALRYEVYCVECGFLPAEQYRNGLESDEFDPHVEHFMALNLDQEIVGTLRLVLPERTASFPYERHCAAVFDDVVLPPREQCGEVSRLVVRKSYRRRLGDLCYGVAEGFLAAPDSHDRRHLENPRRKGDAAAASDRSGDNRRVNSPLILLGLYRAVYRYSLDAGIGYWYAAMERSLARALARFDFAFRQIGPEADYYGPVAPYIGNLREIERLVGSSDPALLAWLQGADPGDGVRPARGTGTAPAGGD